MKWIPLDLFEVVIPGYTGKYLCDENQIESRLRNEMDIVGPLKGVLGTSGFYIGYRHGEQSQIETLYRVQAWRTKSNRNYSRF